LTLQIKKESVGSHIGGQEGFWHDCQLRRHKRGRAPHCTVQFEVVSTHVRSVTQIETI
jgi:hypothetical protein